MRFKQGDPSAAPSLLSDLTHPESDVRKNGERLLETMGDNAAISILKDDILRLSLQSSVNADRKIRAILIIAMVIFIGLSSTMIVKYPSDLEFWIFASIFICFSILIGALCWNLSFRDAADSQRRKLVFYFLDRIEKATQPSAAGPILDVLALPMPPADRLALLRQLARLLRLAGDAEIEALTSAQLATLAVEIRPLSPPDLAIIGLLALATARYADAELLAKTVSLSYGDSRLSAAAREYRSAVGQVVG